MRIYKIYENDYKDLEKMYIRIKAVHKKTALVEHVYWSPSDLKKLETVLYKEAKKHKHYTKSQVDMAVSMYTLQYSPVELKDRDSHIRGFMVVDDYAIAEYAQRSEKNEKEK